MAEFCKGQIEPVARVVKCRKINSPCPSSDKGLQFACITEQMTDSIITTDLDFKITYVNPAFEKMYGYTRDEILGKTPGDINADSDSRMVQNEIYETVSSGGVWQGEVANRRKDGTTFPCELIVFPLIDDAGNIFAYTGTQRDITERKDVEEELRLSEDKFSKAFHSSPDSITVTCFSDGRLLQVNKGFEKMSGYCRDEVIGKTTVELGLWPSQIRQSILNELKINGRVKGLGFCGRNKSGDVNDCLLSCEIIDFNGETCLVKTIRDITELKRVAEQLEVAKERAEAASAAKSEFLANMSHEIRTPISLICGFSDILVSEGLTKQQMVYAELIRNAGKSLLVIINDILDFSKIEAGKLEVSVMDNPLKEIVDDVESMMRPLAADKNIQFGVICSDRLPEMIETDKVRVHQCLVNLVSNAIKFTSKGYVFLNVSMEKNDGEFFIRFDVEDTGIGISVDDQEHIFDSFSQAEKGSTRHFGGTGLGLAITKRLAAILGGGVSLKSREGKGSTFTLVIPAGNSSKSERLQVKNKAGRKIVEVKKDNRLFTGKILVAEDHEGCQVIIRKLLQRLGLKVVLADDGDEAVEKAVNDKFDLIFMDVRMPRLNGFEATAALQKKGITTPIVALTAHAMEGDRQLCIDSGFDDYLSKPIERQKLLEVLERHCRCGSVGISEL